MRGAKNDLGRRSRQARIFHQGLADARGRCTVDKEESEEPQKQMGKRSGVSKVSTAAVMQRCASQVAAADKNRETSGEAVREK